MGSFGSAPSREIKSIAFALLLDAEQAVTDVVIKTSIYWIVQDFSLFIFNFEK
jgi:hypothetical protein